MLFVGINQIFGHLFEREKKIEAFEIQKYQRINVTLLSAKRKRVFQLHF